jgi:rod shape-determining protein MreC
MLVYAILFVICLLMLVVSFGGKFGAPQQLTLEVLGPVQTIFSSVSRGLSNIKQDYVELVHVRETNKLLRAEIARQNEIIGRYREGYMRYLQLEEQLEFKKSIEPPHSVSARIVGKDPDYWFKTIIVDRGLKDGVAVGMVARAPVGVVGQVIHVSENYSKILLANAPSSAIDAMVQKNRVRGILKGGGEKGYTLHYVLKNSDVAVGDDIVTAGISGVFETGITLGKVSAVRKKRRGMFLEIEVTPSVDFQRLETVIISVSEKQFIDKEMTNQ